VVALAVLYFVGVFDGFLGGTKSTSSGRSNNSPPAENRQIETPTKAVTEDNGGVPVEPAKDTVNMIAEVDTTSNKPEEKPQETKPAVEEKQEEKEPEPPPPPPQPSLRISVVPEYNVSLYVDGVPRSQNRSYDLKKGKHEITVMQPDYPIYTENINLQVDKSMRINLEDRFGSNRKLYFNIGISPPDFEDAGLSIVFNGGSVTYSSDNIPITDISKTAGKWQVGFDIKAPSGSSFSSAKIDSFVTFPYGGGPRVRIKGNSGLIDFSQTDWDNLETVGILVYWSK